MVNAIGDGLVNEDEVVGLLESRVRHTDINRRAGRD